jgi:HEAT repeat protein
MSALRAWFWWIAGLLYHLVCWVGDLLYRPLWWLGSVIYDVYLLLNHLMVLSAIPFGVHAPSLKGFVWLLAVYAGVFVLAWIAPSWLTLLALLFGLWGVLAVGRAWGENELQRRRIARKLDDVTRANRWTALVDTLLHRLRIALHMNVKPQDSPDLGLRALCCAVMILWLLPMFFQCLQQLFGLFTVQSDHDSFSHWFLFVIDQTYVGSVSSFLHLYPGENQYIGETGLPGKVCLIGSRWLFSLYVIQSIVSLWSILSDTRDGVTAVKNDHEMAVLLGPRALWPLLRRLDNPLLDLPEKLKIITALGELGGDDVEAKLLALVEAREPLEVRCQAILALGDLDSEKACQKLDHLLDAELTPDDRLIRSSAADALGKIKGGDPVTALRQKLKRFRRPSGKQDLEPDPDVRSLVVRSLGNQLRHRLGHKDVPEVVDLLLQGHGEETRCDPLWSATLQGKRENPWKNLLHDPRFRVMNMTAQALAQLGDQRAIDELIALLRRHGNPTLLQDGARSLGRLITNVCKANPCWRQDNRAKIEQSIAVLVEMVQMHDSDKTQAAVLDALKEIDAVLAAKVMKDALLTAPVQPRSTALVNTAAVLRKLMVEDDGSTFEDLQGRYDKLAPKDDSRAVLWEVLYHLNPERALSLSATETGPDRALS